jgi:hypothetical protein
LFKTKPIKPNFSWAQRDRTSARAENLQKETVQMFDERLKTAKNIIWGSVAMAVAFELVGLAGLIAGLAGKLGTNTMILCAVLTFSGALAVVAKKLAKSHMNISYAYYTAGAKAGQTTVVLKVADVKKAMRILLQDHADSGKSQPVARRPWSLRRWLPPTRILPFLIYNRCCEACHLKEYLFCKLNNCFECVIKPIQRWVFLCCSQNTGEGS